MANEFIARKGIISLDSIQVSGSITATGGITVSGSISSASFATSAATASSADNFFVRQNLTASSALFTGSITAQTLVVQTVTSSITYSSGSNIFGNLPSNVQQFTGSLRVTGSGNHFIQGGNVGIGNSTPANLLTIDGVSTCAKISIETDTVSANTVIGYLDFTNNNAGTTYGRVLGGRNSAGDGYVALGTGVSNNLYALESGYVGIGTSSPSTALHISSSTTQITLQNNAGGTNARRIGMNMTSGDTFKILSLCDNNTTRVDNIIVANVLSGNVGIGTASPEVALHVTGSSFNTGYFFSSNQFSQVWVGTCLTANKSIGIGYDSTNEYGYINVYGTTAGSSLTFKGSSVGIGYTPCSSYGPLQVKSPASTYTIDLVGRTSGLNGESQITFWNSGQTVVQGAIGNIARCMVFYAGGTEVMRMTCGGNLYIGTANDINTAANRTVLTVNGSSTAIINLATGGAQSAYWYHNGTDMLFVNGKNGAALFYTCDNERMRITSEGYLGTTITGTTVSDGDLLGVLAFVSKDSSTYSSGGITNIRSYATQTYNTGNVAGDLRFYVSNGLQNTTGTYCFGTEAMRITCNGVVAIKTTSTSTEGNLFLGANSTEEGGQLVLQKATNYSCATHLDNYANQFRILSGTDTGTTAAHMIIDHTTKNACFYGCLYSPQVVSSILNLTPNTSNIFTYSAGGVGTFNIDIAAISGLQVNGNYQTADIYFQAGLYPGSTTVNGRIGIVGRGGVNASNLYAITCVGGIGTLTITPYGNGTSTFGVCLASNCTGSTVYWKAIVMSMSV